MTYIDRIVRAICVGNESVSFCCGKCGSKIEQAREAISAMRDPPDCLCEAGLETGAVSNDVFYVKNDDIRTVWNAMIERILK